MTLILDISPELEARLAAEAIDRRVPVETLATQALEIFVQMPTRSDRMKTRKEAIRAARGSMSRFPTSVDNFLAEKRVDVERENAEQDAS